MTMPASPSASFCANRPRCVRSASGRERSRAASAATARTVPAPMASTLPTLTRQPASRMTTSGEGRSRRQHAADVGAEGREAVDQERERQHADGQRQVPRRRDVADGAVGRPAPPAQPDRSGGHDDGARGHHGEGQVAEALEPSGDDRRVAEGGVELQPPAQHDVADLEEPVQRHEHERRQEGVDAPRRAGPDGDDDRSREDHDRRTAPGQGGRSVRGRTGRRPAGWRG